VFEECGWTPTKSLRPLVRVKAYRCQKSRVKGSSGNKCSDWWRVWLHGVVPFSMEGITADVEAVHLSIGHDDPLGATGFA